MITYVKGDATAPIGEGPKIIAHCCNDLGAWGGGFVLAISRRWPSPEEEYREWAKREDGALPLGSVQFVQVESALTVANIIGQRGLGANGSIPIRYPAIAEGLSTIGHRAQKTGESVHMPRIGCGLAGGNWNAIEPIIQETLCARGVQVFVYDFQQEVSHVRTYI